MEIRRATPLVSPSAEIGSFTQSLHCRPWSLPFQQTGSLGHLGLFCPSLSGFMLLRCCLPLLFVLGWKTAKGGYASSLEAPPCCPLEVPCTLAEQGCSRMKVLLKGLWSSLYCLTACFSI